MKVSPANRLKQLLIRLGFSLVLFSTLACQKGGGGFNDSGNPAPILQGTSSGNPGGNLVNFDIVFNRVLKDNCVACHQQGHAASGVRYDSYEQTLQHGSLNEVESSYLHYKEPSSQCKTIPKDSMDLVRVWIENGAVN